MASYSELVSQIEDLKKQAERQRKEEYSSVLKTIKRQITEYGITAEELGFNSKSTVSKGRKDAKASKAPKKKRANSGVKVPPKYRDHMGNTWTGRGKTPRWVTEALAAGQSLDSLLIRP